MAGKLPSDEEEERFKDKGKGSIRSQLMQTWRENESRKRGVDKRIASRRIHEWHGRKQINMSRPSSNRGDGRKKEKHTGLLYVGMPCVRRKPHGTHNDVRGA